MLDVWLACDREYGVMHLLPMRDVCWMNEHVFVHLDPDVVTFIMNV